MNQNLRIPVFPTIKLRICTGRIVNADFMRDDEGGFRAPGDDHVA